MKRILISLAVIMVSFAASAQVYIGGALGFMRNETDKTTNFTILPEVGYNFNSKIALGASLGYLFNDDDGYKTNMGAIDPYVRYTFFRSSIEVVSLFLDGTVGFGFGKEQGDSKATFIWDIGVKPGIAIHPSKRFSIVAHIGFAGYQGANDIAEYYGFKEQFGLDFSSLNLNIGFYYNF